MSKPAITGTNHILPFDKLAFSDFERLCLWLVRREGYPEAQHVGVVGNDHGRDILGEKDGKKWAFQCKRAKAFSLSHAEEEIEKIRGLPASDCPDVLVFLVTAAVSAKTRDSVKAKYGSNIECQFWGETELDEKVKAHPEIIDEFFQINRQPAQYPIWRRAMATLVIVFIAGFLFTSVFLLQQRFSTQTANMLPRAEFEEGCHKFYVVKHWDYVEKKFFPAEGPPQVVVDMILDGIIEPLDFDLYVEQTKKLYKDLCPLGEGEFSATANFQSFRGPGKLDLNSWLRAMEKHKFKPEGVVGIDEQPLDWWYLFFTIQDMWEQIPKIILKEMADPGDSDLYQPVRILREWKRKTNRIPSQAESKLKQLSPLIKKEFQTIHDTHANDFIKKFLLSQYTKLQKDPSTYSLDDSLKQLELFLTNEINRRLKRELIYDGNPLSEWTTLLLKSDELEKRDGVRKRNRAAEALGEIGAVRKDRSPSVRASAASALGEIGAKAKKAEEVGPALKRAAREDRASIVREAAEEALKKIDREAAKKEGVK